jgi:hypothetical protein
MGNGSAASVLGVGTVELKLTSRKTIHLKSVQHAPIVNMNLINVSMLCQDGYKLVFESNKVVMSKFGNFIGKCYISIGSFRWPGLLGRLDAPPSRFRSVLPGPPASTRLRPAPPDPPDNLDVPLDQPELPLLSSTPH